MWQTAVIQSTPYYVKWAMSGSPVRKTLPIGFPVYKLIQFQHYIFSERSMSGSYPYGDRSPGKSVVASCRMDSCLLDPQQELLVAYREDNIR